jgi:O-antigen/teichoic acid export membrane protein
MAGESSTGGSALGKGAVFLTIGQGSLILSGYIVNVGLGQLLGPTEFGRFATIASLLTFLETAFLLGIPRTLSKHIAETKGGSRGTLRLCGVLQLLIGGLLCLGLLGMAGPLADWLNDPALEEYFRIVAWAMPSVAVFQYYTKLLNGLTAFRRQAAAVVAFSILRSVLTLGLVALGGGTLGAFWALVLTIALASLVARVLCQARGREQAVDWSWQQVADHAIHLSILTGAVTFLVTVDQLFVKGLMGQGSESGLYAAATLFGKTTRLPALALSAAVFPVVARSESLRTPEIVAADLRRTIRGLAVLLLPLATLVSVMGRSLLTVFFGTLYRSAAGILWPLMLGSILLGLYNVLVSAVAATGGMRRATLISLLMVIVDCALCMVLIPRLGIIGAAGAVVITASIGCSIILRYVTGRFGSVIGPENWAKAVISSALVGGLAYLLRSLTGVWSLVACVALYIAHFGILAILGEIGRDDIGTVLSMLSIAGTRETEHRRG